MWSLHTVLNEAQRGLENEGELKGQENGKSDFVPVLTAPFSAWAPGEDTLLVRWRLQLLKQRQLLDGDAWIPRGKEKWTKILTWLGDDENLKEKRMNDTWCSFSCIRLTWTVGMLGCGAKCGTCRPSSPSVCRDWASHHQQSRPPTWRRLTYNLLYS